MVRVSKNQTRTGVNFWNWNDNFCSLKNWTQNKIVDWIYLLNENWESSNLLFNSELEVLHKSKELPNTDFDMYLYTR
jgi:hypothetical protein